MTTKCSICTWVMLMVGAMHCGIVTSSTCNEQMAYIVENGNNIDISFADALKNRQVTPNISTDAWPQKSPYMTLVWANAKLWAVGGSKCTAYDSASETWSELLTTGWRPFSRAESFVNPVTNKTNVLVCGCTVYSCKQSCALAEVDANGDMVGAWTRFSHADTKLRFDTGPSCVHKGKMYIHGGESHDSLYEFDSVTRQFTPVDGGDTINIRRTHHAMASLGDGIVVCGGRDKATRSIYLKSCEKFTFGQGWVLLEGTIPDEGVIFAILLSNTLAEGSLLYGFGETKSNGPFRKLYQRTVEGIWQQEPIFSIASGGVFSSVSSTSSAHHLLVQRPCSSVGTITGLKDGLPNHIQYQTNTASNQPPYPTGTRVTVNCGTYTVSELFSEPKTYDANKDPNVRCVDGYWTGCADPFKASCYCIVNQYNVA